MIKVFTYGSLMTGMSNHAVMEKNNGKLIKKAEIKGRMRAYCPSFPGVASSEVSTVKGEIFEVNALGLIHLDILEGEGHFYHRRSVTTLCGEEVYAYFLNPENMKGPIIKTGDWRGYCEGEPNAINKPHAPQTFAYRMGYGAEFWWEEG